MRPELRFIDDDPKDAPLVAPPAASAEPKVFSRVLTTPAGWPWEQTKAAGLEARHGAPLPLGELQLQVRRLTPWRPQTPAKFVAIYARSAQIRRRFQTSVVVDDHTLEVTFEPPAAMKQRAQTYLRILLAVLVIAGAVVASVSQALVDRADSEARLSALEQSVDAKLKHAEALHAQARDAAILQAVHPGKTAQVVLRDLAWTAAVKTPDAHLEAWRWERGLVAVEVRGTSLPFLESPQPPRRAANPIRHNVWLWGVDPSPPDLLGRRYESK